MPAAWLTDDAEAERRRPWGLPPDLTVNTKPELAPELSAAVVKSQALRWRWGVADEACGGNPALLDGVAGLGRWYCTAVAHTTRVWAARPATHLPPWRGRGRPPQRGRLVAGAPEAQTGRGTASALPAAAWTRQRIQEGSPGPRVAEFAALRVVAVRDALPGPDVWLGLRRHVETKAVKTSRCHAPVDTTVATRVRLRGMRWPIATCCEDGKPRRGMGDEEVRSWTGWPHHMPLVMLAHFLVVRRSLR